MLSSLSPKTRANRDVTNAPQSLHAGIVQSLGRTWRGLICGRSLSVPSTFFAILMSFVRLCDVFGGDLLSTASGPRRRIFRRDRNGSLSREFSPPVSGYRTYRALSVASEDLLLIR